MVRIPAGATKFSLFLLVQAIPVVHPDSYSNYTRSFQGLTRPGRNFDKPSPRVEVRMSGSIHLLATCLYGVEGRKIAFGCVLKISERGEEIQLAKGRV